MELDEISWLHFLANMCTSNKYILNYPFNAYSIQNGQLFYTTRSEWVEYLIWCPQICSISYYGAHQVPRCWETGKKCVRFAVFEKKLKTILKNGPFSPVFCEFTWLWHISGFTTLSKDETQLPVLLTLIPQLLWISESPVAPKTTINIKCYRL